MLPATSFKWTIHLLYNRRYYGVIHCTEKLHERVRGVAGAFWKLLQCEEALHHARMDMHLIHLPGRSFHLASKDTISLSSECLEASIVASMVHDNGAGRVRAPSIAARSPWTEVMCNLLNVLILHTIRDAKMSCNEENDCQNHELHEFYTMKYQPMLPTSTQ